MNGRQAILLEMLKATADILDRNGIAYFSAYGTSIGAVRHGGFIPWDDDIDLYVFHEDAERIRQAMARELDTSRYYYHEPSTDLLPHIMFKGDDFLGSLERRETPFIDLFLLQSRPRGLFRRFLTAPFVWTMILVSVLSGHVGSEPVSRLLSRAMDAFRRIIRALPEPDSEELVVYTTRYTNSIYRRSDFDGEVRMPFEDTEVPLPRNYDRMLRAQYGDYMTPPPEGRRAGASGFPVGVERDYLKRTR